MGLNCPHCNQNIDNAIPKERFDEVNRKKTEAETAAANAARQAAQAEALAQQLDASRKELADVQRGYKMESAFMQHGLMDPSEREVFGYYYEKQAKGEGGVTEPDAWLASLKAEGAQPPAALAKLLTPAAQPGQPAKPAQPAPAVNAGAKQPATSGQAFSAADIRRMSPQEFNNNYDAIRALYPSLGLPEKKA